MQIVIVRRWGALTVRHAGARLIVLLHFDTTPSVYRVQIWGFACFIALKMRGNRDCLPAYSEPDLRSVSKISSGVVHASSRKSGRVANTSCGSFATNYCVRYNYSMSNEITFTPAIMAGLPLSDFSADAYRFSEQIGHLLRRAYQRHMAIFQAAIPDSNLTAAQFVTLCAVKEQQSCSFTDIVKATAIDQATIRGVIERLQARSLGLCRVKDDATIGRLR